MILASILIFNESTPTPSIFLLPAIIGTMLVIHYYDTESHIGQLLKFKYIVFIGVISYSAYLWHQPLFSLARIKLVREPSSIEYLSLILAILIISVLSWRYIETPFRKAKNLSGKYLISLSIISTAALITAGWHGYNNNGYPERFEATLAGDVGHDEFNQYLDANFQDCSIKNSYPEITKEIRCKSNHSSTSDIVLLGDSHAEHLFPGYVNAFPDKNITYYTAGAPPYLHVDEFKLIFEELLEREIESQIHIAIHFPFRLNPKELKKYGSIEAGLKESITKLKDAGHSVFLLADIPWYEIHAANCIFLNEGKAPRQCEMNLSAIYKQESHYLPLIKTLTNETDIKTIEIKDPLCSETKCSMIIDNTIYYRDGNHLNIPGSNLIAEHIARQIHKY